MSTEYSERQENCPRCNEVKPISDFYSNRAARNGRSSYCKSCSKKYARRNPLPPEQVPEQKSCIDCKEVKPLTEFYKNATKRDGVDQRCKSCKDKRHVNAYLKYRYKSSESKRNKLLAAQAGKCAICGAGETVVLSQNKPPCLKQDHNHKTGQVRGLLCLRCNTLVGHIENAEEHVLKNALEYIKHYSEVYEAKTRATRVLYDEDARL